MKRIAALVLLAALLCAGWALRGSAGWLSEHGPRCVFHDLTGLYCPGCGGTRAFMYLTHGDLVDAVRMNVLTVVAMGFGAYALIRYAATGRSVDVVGPQGRRGVAIAWVFVAFFLLRNVPFAPFSYLAPPKVSLAAIGR